MFHRLRDLSFDCGVYLKNIQLQFHFDATSLLHDYFIISTQGRVTAGTLSPLELQTKPTNYNCV